MNKYSLFKIEDKQYQLMIDDVLDCDIIFNDKDVGESILEYLNKEYHEKKCLYNFLLKVMEYIQFGNNDEDKLLEIEEEYFTQIFQPSEEFTKEMLAEFANLFFDR